MRKIEPKSRKEQYGESPAKESDKKDIYPMVTLEHDSVPEAKDWKVGKKYTVKMKLKKVEHNESRFQNSSGFEMHGFEPDEDSMGEADEDADKMGDDEKY